MSVPLDRAQEVEPVASTVGGFTGWYGGMLRRRGGWLLLAGAAATLAVASGLPRIEVSNPPARYALPPDDPVSLEFDAFRALFGFEESILVGLDYGRQIGPAEFEHAAQITAALARLDGVAAVRAPASQGDPTFVAADGRSLLILVEPELSGNAGTDAARRLHRAVRQQLREHGGGLRAYHLAGMPLINEAFEEHLRRDVRSFVVLGGVLAIVLLLVLYGSAAAVLISGAAAVVSLVWALGIVGFAATPLSMGLAMMIPLMLMLSVAYSAHYVSHWLRCRAHRDVVLQDMLASVLGPSLLTGIATSLGFVALNLSAIQGLRDVGRHLGAAALLAALISATLVPALLYRYVPPGGRAGVAAARLPNVLAGLLRRAVVGRSAAVIGTALLVAGASLAGLRQVRVDANHLAYLDTGTQVRQDFEEIDRNFGGVVPLEIVVAAPAGEVGAVTARIIEFSASLRAMEGMGRVISLPELAALAGVPDPGPSGWRQLGTVAGPDRLLRTAGADTLLFRTSARVHIRGTNDLGLLLQRVRLLAGETFGGAATVTGMLPLFVRTMDWLVRGQIMSFAVAFVGVAVLFLLLAGNLLTGSFAVSANVLPILAVLGFMGWSGVPLDFGTAMIASVLMGIAVHDTIHVLASLRRERAGGAATADALNATFAAVGPPIVISTVVFCCGLLVLTLSDFAPVRHFGLLSCAAMLAALLADLLLLPALIVFSERHQ